MPLYYLAYTSHCFCQLVNSRRTGGVWTPPQVFSQISRKNGGADAAVFGTVSIYLHIVTVAINTVTVSPSGFGHVVILERSARAVVASAPPEILDPSDFAANTKCMGKWCVLICFSSHILSLKLFSKILPGSCA